MLKHFIFFVCLIFLSGSCRVLLNAQGLDRKDVPLKYKWNLEEIFLSKDAWNEYHDQISKRVDDILRFKGKLHENAEILYDALKTYFDILNGIYKLSTYAGRLSDQDLGNSENQALNQKASYLQTQFSENSSFISPEILRIEPEKIKEFFEEKKELTEYKMFIDDIQRLSDHILTADKEKLLASFGLPEGTPAEVFNIFNNAEMPYAKIELSTGETVTLSPAAYTKYRSTENRGDRKKVFSAFFNNYQNYQNTLGANYNGKLKFDYVFAKVRKYPSALAGALDANNIPASLYENLIAQVHRSLPTLERFLNLKKKMLGLDTLHYYDLYIPLVKKVDLTYTIEEGQEIILNALKPMGQVYLSTLEKAFNERWIDYMPTKGKKSGAYSTGAAYDVHPYILTNWTDDYGSLTTLAHELGHTMHSYFSNANQTFANAQYPIFVAEIASTFNENLLNHYMVQNADSKEEKLYLLGSYLELMRTTIFRQTLFAEFEWDVHKMVENNEPVTGEALSKLYYELVKEYYGADKGVCVVDPYIAYEWEYIPHFVNYTYYVYQYSTSLIYSTALAEKVFAEGQPAVSKYYNLLEGGGSDYPINLIKKTGVDPLSAEPFKLTMKKMNDIMDQIEKLLNEK